MKVLFLFFFFFSFLFSQDVLQEDLAPTFGVEGILLLCSPTGVTFTDPKKEGIKH